MSDARAQGRDALSRGAWDEARAAFARAAAEYPAPDAYEGLGIAARYALDADAAFAAHEEGYRLAREAGDPDAAARLAVQLGYDAYCFRSVPEAIGWAERAAMLVEGRPASFATAFVPYIRGYMALLGEHDPARAREGSAAAVRLAREVGAVDLELMAVALEGLALVAEGRVSEGMSRLDAAAAAAVGGEMTDADSIETVCCFVIDACKRVRDLERASEWCLRTRDIATRFGDRQMFTVCRVHYADVLLWHGDLDRAGRELEAAVDELGRLRPGRDVDALVRLAELRRRQGRHAEAEDALARSGPHRLHALVSGLLAMDRGDAAGAAECAARFLRRIGDADRFERVAGLELLVRAALGTGDRAAAEAAAAEITEVSRAANAPLRAAGPCRRAACGGGRRRRRGRRGGGGRGGPPGRRGGALRRGARPPRARRGAERRGAAARAATARAAGAAALRELGAAVPGGDGVPAGPLSPREREVLHLLALGRGNDDIARELVLSVRTVERHVANIYGKIGASGRTARAAATAWAHAHGIG
ncbi:MAG: helix-turn-helix transcriptional regulator [Thermoleophilia bacterium]